MCIPPLVAELASSVAGQDVGALPSDSVYWVSCVLLELVATPILMTYQSALIECRH